MPQRMLLMEDLMKLFQKKKKILRIRESPSPGIVLRCKKLSYTKFSNSSY